MPASFADVLLFSSQIIEEIWGCQNVLYQWQAISPSRDTIYLDLYLQGLHYSFQTRDKLYFVLDYVNGGEVFKD